LPFKFSHLTGVVVEVPKDYMIIKEAGGGHKHFHLNDLESRAESGDAVVAIFGARNETRLRTLAAVRNLTRNCTNVRASHFHEELNTRSLVGIAIVCALLCVGLVLAYFQHTGDLFAPKPISALVVLCAGWALPLRYIERERAKYVADLSDYIKSTNEDRQANDKRPQDPDVEYL
jgi:hypothetical protein